MNKVNGKSTALDLCGFRTLDNSLKPHQPETRVCSPPWAQCLVNKLNQTCLIARTYVRPFLLSRPLSWTVDKEERNELGCYMDQSQKFSHLWQHEVFAHSKRFNKYQSNFSPDWTWCFEQNAREFRNRTIMNQTPRSNDRLLATWSKKVGNFIGNIFFHQTEMMRIIGNYGICFYHKMMRWLNNRIVLIYCWTSLWTHSMWLHSDAADPLCISHFFHS